MHRRHRRRKGQRKIIIFSLIGLLFIMAVGYSAFQTNLNINVKGNIARQSELYVSSTGSDDTGNGTIAKPYATVQRAYNKAASPAIIYVMDNITAIETTNLDQDKEITLTSYSEDSSVNSIIRGDSLTSTVLNQTVGTLTLENIIVDGNNVEAQSSLIYSTANLNVNAGAVIQNNNTTTNGGGICIEGSATTPATLNLNGAQISNNTAYIAGGVYGRYSQIHIDGETIINENIGSYDCGGMNLGHCSFTMTSGSISYNESSHDAGGILFVYNTEATISGGSISGNQSGNSGGIYVAHGSKVTMTGGVISNNQVTKSAGGVGIIQIEPYTGTEFILNGGKIMNNSSTDTDRQGGIYNFDETGTYTYQSGVVCGNTPTNSYETHETCPS